MKIYLVDKQKWILVTKEEMKRIINSNIKPENFTSSSIQQFLIF